jgi:hypothetical protein
MVVKPDGRCWCGCGAQLDSPMAFFVAGHDKVAESRLIKDRYGSVAEFLVAHGYGRKHIDTKQDIDLDAAIARLKALAEAEEGTAVEWGRASGRRWAATTATPVELRGMADYVKVLSVADWSPPRESSAYDWLGSAMDPDVQPYWQEFHEGFVEGALAIWDKVRDAMDRSRTEP